MKKITTKALALICSAAMVLPMAACSGSGNGSGHGGGRNNGGSGSKPQYGDPTDPTSITVDPTDPTADPTTPVNNGGYIPTSDTLTYPDHVPTYDEIHPAHAHGNVSGQEASDLLDEIEDEFGDAYDDGFDEGYDTGYADGYLKAKNELKKETEKHEKIACDPAGFCPAYGLRRRRGGNRHAPAGQRIQGQR